LANQSPLQAWQTEKYLESGTEDYQLCRVVWTADRQHG